MATAKNVSLRSCTAECNCPLTPAATLTSLTVGCLGHTPGATPSQCWCGGQGRGTQAGLFLGSRGAPRMGEFGVRTPCWPWQNFKKTTLQFMTSLPPSILPSLPPSQPQDRHLTLTAGPAFSRPPTSSLTGFSHSPCTLIPS